MATPPPRPRMRRFTAELTPYRSLGRRGFKVFFLIAGLLSLVHVVVFFIIGAWPVVFFFGLDYLLLFGAFWLNNRSALSREEVSVSRTDVSVRKFTLQGRSPNTASIPSGRVSTSPGIRR